MFSQAYVKNSAHRGRGMPWQGGHVWQGCTWQEGAYMAGGVCGRKGGPMHGREVHGGRVCMVGGGVHGSGACMLQITLPCPNFVAGEACMAGACVVGRHAWQGVWGRGACVAGGMHGRGVSSVAEETATAADGTNPTGMRSCFK